MTANRHVGMVGCGCRPFGVADVVLEHGRTADLIVASQTDDDWPAGGWLDVAVPTPAWKWSARPDRAQWAGLRANRQPHFGCLEWAARRRLGPCSTPCHS